jgi:hypothetical protein
VTLKIVFYYYKIRGEFNISLGIDPQLNLINNIFVIFYNVYGIIFNKNIYYIYVVYSFIILNHKII